MQELPVD